jgi:hypothetical protein
MQKRKLGKSPSLSLIIPLISAAGRISIVPQCYCTPGDWEMS